MKYKLYKENRKELSAIQQILYNRGIPIGEQEKWLNANKEDIVDWKKCGNSRIFIDAVKCLQKHIENEDNIVLNVDVDCDGYTSSALIINYLYKHYPEYAENHIDWIHHKGKEHGLKDLIKQILESEKNYKLVICPDSSSNDLDEHKQLAANDIDCIILDHHEYDAAIAEATPAHLINVQGWKDYPNKALTGAGIAYKFICAYEEEIIGGTVAAPFEFIDLCALGNCGDMADYRQLEIRAIINEGFSHIKNPFFYAMSEKNKYSIDKMNGINYLSAAFYVVPFINAIVRSGAMEEKELVFQSMLTMKAFNEVECSKRGHKGEKVKLYEEAVTVAERVKRRQTKLQDETMELLDQKIVEENLLDNAILLFLCNPGEVEKNVAGLIANKYQAKYQRPCLVLTKSKTINDKEYFYRGSGRNYSLSELDNLKETCIRTNIIEYAEGQSVAL